jgi:hypothetical protein
MKKYTTKVGTTQFKQSLKTVETAIRNDDSTGFCLACGAEQGGTEPDARNYTCEACGAAKVFGAEELLIMGLVY